MVDRMRPGPRVDGGETSPSESGSARTRTKRRRPSLAHLATVVGVLAGLASVGAFIKSQLPHEAWDERADAVCLRQFDRMQTFNGHRPSARQVWESQVHLYQELDAINTPARIAFTWRPIVNSTADLAWIWGLAAHVADHDPAGPLNYYRRGIDEDLRTFRASASALKLSTCASGSLNKEEKLALGSFIGL